MIDSKELNQIFRKNGFNFFTGVPDSTFKQFIKFLSFNHNNILTNIIAPNEGAAVAIASGYYLATGKIAVVYMQNAGLGNIVNPQTSLSDKEVYSIPILYLIGWRGEPNEKDEPQHKKMGRITIPLLETLEIPYEVLPIETGLIEETIMRAKKIMEENKSAYALIIKKESFKEYTNELEENQDYEMKREEAIGTILENLSGNEVIISTTGKTSRELFELREKRNEKHEKDFLTVVSMGFSSSIALGIALKKQDKKIFVFDGDGSVIMHQGAIPTIGYYNPKNLYHVIFDNESYDSTGGQPTISKSINFKEIALACNYKKAIIIQTKEDLSKKIKEIIKEEGPQLIIIKIKKGSRKDLKRPTTTPIENKEKFMEFLKDDGN